MCLWLSVTSFSPNTMILLIQIIVGVFVAIVLYKVLRDVVSGL